MHQPRVRNIATGGESFKENRLSNSQYRKIQAANDRILRKSPMISQKSY